MTSNEDALLIRRCAYWLDLRGWPETANKETVTVKLPRSQRFDVAALRAMVQNAYERLRPQEGGAA